MPLAILQFQYQKKTQLKLKLNLIVFKQILHFHFWIYTKPEGIKRGRLFLKIQTIKSTLSSQSYLVYNYLCLFCPTHFHANVCCLDYDQ